MRKRDKKLAFWVTEGEKNRIQKIADKSGMKQGDYLMTAALGKTIYQVEELRPMLHELKGIGRNLNQLTVLAHKGQVSVVNLSEAVRVLTKNIQVINGLYEVVDGRIAGGNGSEDINDGDV